MPKRRRRHDDIDIEEGDPIEALTDWAMDHPRAQEGLARVRKTIDQLGVEMVDHVGRALDGILLKQVSHDRERQRQYVAAKRRLRHIYQQVRQKEARAKEAERAAHQRTEDPRIVLGFGPNQHPTAPEIKSRQRELAVICHPDRPGGSTEAMARINRAAEQLLANSKG